MDHHLFSFWTLVFDVVDVVLVWFIFYQVSFLFRNTRSTKLIFGAAIIAFLYAISLGIQLEGLLQVFQAINIVQIGSIVLVIIFSQEIKEALTSIGIKRMTHYIDEDSKTIEAVNQACLKLSANQVGALILIARRDNLKDLASEAIVLNADVSSQVIESLFFEPSGKTKGNNPLHDGAVVISDNKILAAKVICKQLSESIELSHQGKGTRHAAGLGFTEQRDCMAVMVSHETGNISLASHNEKTLWDIDRADLLMELKKGLGLNGVKANTMDDIRRWFLERKIAKIASLLLAIIVWAISSSTMTLSVRIPEPSIYAEGHVWKEGDFVVSKDANQDDVGVFQFDVRNWSRVFLMVRPVNGGIYALRDSLQIQVSEEDVLKQWDLNKTKLKSQLVIKADFQNEATLSERNVSDIDVSLKIQKLVKIDLKEKLQFHLENHQEVESISWVSSANILAPENFDLSKVILINLLDRQKLKEKDGLEIWQDIQTLPKLKINYTDFTGILAFKEIPELAELSQYNSNLEFKFRMVVRGVMVDKSEEEIIAEKELQAVRDQFQKTLDELIDLTDKEAKLDRQQVIAASIQRQKSHELHQDTLKQIDFYQKKKANKNIEIQKIEKQYSDLKAKTNLSTAEHKSIKELESKRVQFSRVQTIYDQILEVYNGKIKDLERRSVKSEEIFQKYIVAFKPVLTIYDEAKKKMELRQQIKPLETPVVNFKNIQEQIAKVNQIKIDVDDGLVSFFEVALNSLDTYLVSPLYSKKLGSLHELVLKKKEQYEQIDLILDTINKHLTPTEMPAWLEQHKVQTFLYCEELNLQTELLAHLEDKIKFEKEYLEKAAPYKEQLLLKLGEVLVGIQTDMSKKRVVFKGIKEREKKVEALLKKLNELKVSIGKSITYYEQEKAVVDRKAKSFKVPAYIDNSNAIINETRKGLEEWPENYREYTMKFEKEDYHPGHSRIKLIFQLINAGWDTINASITTVEEANVTQLKRYLGYLNSIENILNEVSSN